MKDSRHFFIISSIIHLLMFIMLAYVILPPEDRFRDLIDSLSVDIMKEIPAVREEIPVRDRVEPQAEPQVKPEVHQEPKPPDLERFSVPATETAINPARGASSEKRAALTAITPPEKVMVSTQPYVNLMKPIQHSADDESIVMAPILRQDEGNIADAGALTGFSNPQVGTVGVKASSRGSDISSYYFPLISAQQREPGIEFADILPALAKGILGRSKGKKMDIVFVIDTTGSMRDNVRGVKDYISDFLKPLEDERLDVALGLVEFTDVEARESKVFGLTKDQKKFRKWLDKTIFLGGADLPESGYEALISTLESIDYRDGSQKAFILISDAPQHDFDYDGKSRYSLDRIIARMNDEGISVDVVGARYLPMMQLAWGTGGQWKHIPGGDPSTDIPYLTSSMIRSNLGRSIPSTLVEDTVTIEFNNSGVPDWVDFSYKMLNPLGLKCLGTLTYRKEIKQKSERKVEFFPKIDLSKFGDQPGTYTLIYRIRDSMGNSDILRRTLELRRIDS